jgi:perosamine synthetase
MDKVVPPEQQLGVGYLTISEKEKYYVNQALDSNRLSYGPFSRKFESGFARIHGSKHAIMSNSGTSALQIALAALKEKYNWRDGGEVIVPAVTFVATANVVLMLGLNPVFVDVDPKTYNIDSKLIEETISAQTLAIIPVHMFGLPANMDPIMDIANKYKLRVVEDSCEAMFVKSYGKSVGSFGDVGCFSTYVAHFLVTGVGGLSITDDDELALMMRSLCNHGRDGMYLNIDDDKNKDRKELSTVIQKRFNFVRLGYSYRVTELEAALGVAQLENKDQILATRQANARYLIEGLKPLQEAGFLQLPSVPEYAEHAFMIFPIVISDPGIERDELTLYLEENMIETRPMMPLINQPFYVEKFGIIEDDFPVAKWINHNGFYIGCHQGFRQTELDYIVAIFEKFFKG